MANRPYQEKVDQFMADYQDKFLPTLITGKGTPEAPYTNMGGPEAAIPMTKEQGQLERDKLLASSIHPDTFSKVLDVMSGKGTPGSPFTNLSGPETAIPYRGGGGGGAPIPGGAISPYNPQLNRPNLPEILKRIAIYNPEITTPEAQQLLFPAEPTPFTVGGETSGTLDELRAAGRLKDFQAAIPPDFAKGGGLATGEKAVPTLESVWGIKKEGNVYTLPGGEGTMTVGPERFFIGDKEVPAGTPGAVSGDQLARERIGREGGSAIPLSAMGEAPIPRTYNLRLPDGSVIQQTEKPIPTEGGIPGYEMPGEIRTALQGIQKILMQPSGAIYSPSGRQAFAGGYRPHQIAGLENFAGTLEKMAATGVGYQTKMAEIGAEKPYREAMGDYYRGKLGVEERALPSEIAGRTATAELARSQTHGPILGADQSMWMNGKWITAPGRTKPAQDLMEGIRKSSMKVDPNTGAPLGFDEATFKGTMRAYVKAGFLTRQDVNPDYLKIGKEEWIAAKQNRAIAEKRKVKPKELEEAWGRWQKMNPAGY